MTGVGVALLLIAGLGLAVWFASRPPSDVVVELDGDVLVVTLTGASALLGMRRPLRIPVTSVAGVAVAHQRLVPRTGLRMGMDVPGMRWGSYGRVPDRDFWFVRNGEQYLVIQLHPGEPYRRLVLEVADPQAKARELRPVVGAYPGLFES